jgi:hypothetical protein
MTATSRDRQRRLFDDVADQQDRTWHEATRHHHERPGKPVETARTVHARQRLVGDHPLDRSGRPRCLCRGERRRAAASQNPHTSLGNGPSAAIRAKNGRRRAPRIERLPGRCFELPEPRKTGRGSLLNLLVVFRVCYSKAE